MGDRSDESAIPGEPGGRGTDEPGPAESPDPPEALPETPRREVVPDVDEGSGTVVWHREDLRIRDNPAVARAAESDRLLPVFVLDPAFYGDRGLACDARIGLLHDCLRDLDDRYHTAGGGAAGAGLTYAHGDPVAVLERFRDAGWDVVATRTPSGRYGHRRDERAREADVEFVDAGGLVYDAERTREDWQERIERWLAAEPHDPDLRETAVEGVDTGITLAAVEDAYDVEPTKSEVPTGGTTRGRERLESFVARIGEYPGSISSPVDAREGTSGLSPYLRFGCLSVRQVHRYVEEHAPDGRGKEMFVSRLFWNRHYAQKLADWPGWTDVAVNPVMRGFNADRRDPDLIDAWKRGRTGFPMVDASMRCLAGTGWLNFRMRAMCASFFGRILAQPWRVGADWFHRHLVDSDAAINYTQWQYQAGVVGKPTQRLYDPRKQVRDQDLDGEFVSKWVPELAALPAEHLDEPEKTPVAVQEECGVRIGEDYPRPVVDFEAARERYWQRFDAVKAEAAAAFADETVARRVSFSGGLGTALSLAEEYGPDDDEDDGGRQASLAAFD